MRCNVHVSTSRRYGDEPFQSLTGTDTDNQVQNVAQKPKKKKSRLTIVKTHKNVQNKLCGRPPQYAPAPCKLTFDLLTQKVVSESRVTWATSVPILVFLGLSVLDLGPLYTRQTDVRRASLNVPYPRGGGIINYLRETTSFVCRYPVSSRCVRGPTPVHTS